MTYDPVDSDADGQIQGYDVEDATDIGTQFLSSPGQTQEFELGVDVPGSGGSTVVPAGKAVNDNGNVFDTIQAAHDDTGDGGFVKYGAGTFNEEVSLSHSFFSLIGPGRAGVIVGDGSAPTVSTLDGAGNPENQYLYQVHAAIDAGGSANSVFQRQGGNDLFYEACVCAEQNGDAGESFSADIGFDGGGFYQGCYTNSVTGTSFSIGGGTAVGCFADLGGEIGFSVGNNGLVMGCTSFEPGTRGIDISGATNCAIIGNRIQEGGGTSNQHLQGTGNGAVVVGNVSLDCSGFAFVMSGQRQLIANNYVENCTNIPFVANSTEQVFKNNVIRNSGTTPIQLNGTRTVWQNDSSNAGDPSAAAGQWAGESDTAYNLGAIIRDTTNDDLYYPLPPAATNDWYRVAVTAV